MSEDAITRYTTKRLHDEIKKAEERGRQYALEELSKKNPLSVSDVELMALKKLALISGALAKSLSDQTAAREQMALTKVLVDVVSRADIALSTPHTPTGE